MDKIEILLGDNDLPVDMKLRLYISAGVINFAVDRNGVTQVRVGVALEEGVEPRVRCTQSQESVRCTQSEDKREG